MKCKYFVFRHEHGKPEYMDQNITQHTCLSQEDAMCVCQELNRISEKCQLKYKYYVVMV